MRNPLLLLTAAVLIVAGGCKKDKVVRATNISNVQAATMVATLLSSNANGFANIKNDMVIYAKGVSNAGKGCGVIDSFAVARQDAASSSIDYNYALGYNYMVNCVNNIQNDLTASIIYNGSFDAATLSEVNSATAAFNLASLSGSATTYLLNGTYQAQGTFQTHDATQLSGSNSINIAIKDLLVTKSNRNIVSGTAILNVAGNIKNKNTFSYNGTLTFTNTNTAALTLEGVNYSINLTTADLTTL